MHFALGSLEGIGLKKVLMGITGTHPTFAPMNIGGLFASDTYIPDFISYTDHNSKIPQKTVIFFCF